MNRAVADYWSEHYINVDVGLCGLCANTGKINTSESAISQSGVRAGGVHYCICPNGQKMRERVSVPPARGS